MPNKSRKAVLAYAAVFGRGFIIVSLVAANTVQIAGHHYGGAFVVGAAISAFWFGNARVAAITPLRFAREVYSAGAGLGTVCGMWVMRVLYG